MTERINRVVFDTLVDLDPQTLAIIPALAERWQVKGSVLEFALNSAARFKNGNPVTCDDVRFTWEAIQQRSPGLAQAQAFFSPIRSVECPEPGRVRIHRSTAQFPESVLRLVTRLFILPRHPYATGNFLTDHHETLLGSGPYRGGAVRRGALLSLHRVRPYWGEALPQHRGRYHFDEIQYRFIENTQVRYEALVKGDIDYFNFTTAKLWAQPDAHWNFERGRIGKLEIKNRHPSLVAAVVFNQRHPVLRDRRVRQALAAAFERDRFNRDLFFNQYQLLRSIYGVHPPYLEPPPPSISFSMERARELLKEAGWTPSKRGLVHGSNSGQPLTFRILFHTGASVRFLTLYQERLAELGIALELEQLDWASVSRRLDEKRFDAVYLIWSGELFPNPRPMWHSKECAREGGTNFLCFQNSRVDRAIEALDREPNPKKRAALFRRIDQEIAMDSPLILAWARDRFHVGLWSHIEIPPGEIRPYADWDELIHDWSIKKDSETISAAAY